MGNFTHDWRGENDYAYWDARETARERRREVVEKLYSLTPRSAEENLIAPFIKKEEHEDTKE